jgi:alpha-L-fucosidase 2
VAAKAEPTAAEIAQARSGLNRALAGLVPAVDGDALGGALQIAAGLGPVQAQYTAASWQVLTDAIAAAEAAVSEVEDQSVVDDAAAGLRAALTGLRSAPVVPDTTGRLAVLTGLVGNAERLTPATYTPESWQALAAAVAAGKVTAAKPGVTPGEVEQATAALGQALAGLIPATVTVLEEVPPVPAAVWKVKTAQKTLTVKAGQSVTLPARAYLANGSKAAVKIAWKSSNPKVATVTAKGKITGKKTGKTTITLKSGSKTATVKVTVVPKTAKTTKASKVKATGVPKTMTVGQVTAMTGSYTPAKATKAKITYRSARPAIVTVDKNGIVQAKAAGTAKITIKAGKATKTYTIRVT